MLHFKRMHAHWLEYSLTQCKIDVQIYILAKVLRNFMQVTNGLIETLLWFV